MNNMCGIESLFNSNRNNVNPVEIEDEEPVAKILTTVIVSLAMAFLITVCPPLIVPLVLGFCYRFTSKEDGCLTRTLGTVILSLAAGFLLTTFSPLVVPLVVISAYHIVYKK